MVRHVSGPVVWPVTACLASTGRMDFRLGDVRVAPRKGWVMWWFLYWATFGVLVWCALLWCVLVLE